MLATACFRWTSPSFTHLTCFLLLGAPLLAISAVALAGGFGYRKVAFSGRRSRQRAVDRHEVFQPPSEYCCLVVAAALDSANSQVALR